MLNKKRKKLGKYSINKYNNYNFFVLKKTIRAFIEDQYARSLVKASKKLFVMDKGSLGYI